jgi:hypothetical protein
VVSEECLLQHTDDADFLANEWANSVNPVTGSTATAVSAALSGLTAGTTYHYRVVGTNGGGTTNGADASFTTLADTCATNAALCPPPPVGDTDGDGAEG